MKLLSLAVPSQQPVLILSGEHNILAASANDMLSDPVEIYTTEHIITGTYLVILLFKTKQTFLN